MGETARAFFQRHLDRFSVGEDGNIYSTTNGRIRQVAHSGNTRQNLYVKVAGPMDEDGNRKIHGMSAGRVAWGVHYGTLPPEHMSVMFVNGNKRDFSKDNLMLVPRGKENTAKKAVREAQTA